MECKIALIAFSSIDVAPYLRKYIEILNDEGVRFDLFTKVQNSEKLSNNNSNVKELRFECSIRPTFIGRLLQHNRWKNFIIKGLIKGNYQRIVVFTIPAALILSNYLRKHYNGKYVIDVRDFWPWLKYRIISKKLEALAKEASMIISSSKGFYKWLPSDSVIRIMHNLPTKTEIEKAISSSNIGVSTNIIAKQQITIGYLGNIGYKEYNFALADAFRDSSNYSLLYAGMYPKKYNIQNYCLENNIKNIIILPSYDVKEKKEIYKRVDLINAVYGCENEIVRTALPNKLYDAAIYMKPIIVSSNTYLAKVVNQYGLGIDINIYTENIYKKVDTYVKTFNVDKFVANCNRFLEDVLAEQKETENELISRLIKE